MIHILRKIKCKYNGSDDYLPEGIPRDKWMHVIGYEVRRRNALKNDKEVVVEDIFYLVTNNSGKMITIASFNCATMIDEKGEVDIAAAVDLLRNISKIGVVLSEQMGKMVDTKNDKQDQKGS